MTEAGLMLPEQFNKLNKVGYTSYSVVDGNLYSRQRYTIPGNDAAKVNLNEMMPAISDHDNLGTTGITFEYLGEYLLIMGCTRTFL